MLINEDISKLIEICKERGWRISYHNHPKTRANWDKPWGRNK